MHLVLVGASGILDSLHWEPSVLAPGPPGDSLPFRIWIPWFLWILETNIGQKELLSTKTYSVDTGRKYRHLVKAASFKEFLKMALLLFKNFKNLCPRLSLC